MRPQKIAGGKMVKSLAPFVYWAQTESEVLMRVDLKNVEEPTITLGNLTATYRIYQILKFCRIYSDSVRYG
jgi:hypothetical protein